MGRRCFIFRTLYSRTFRLGLIAHFCWLFISSSGYQNIVKESKKLKSISSVKAMPSLLDENLSFVGRGGDALEVVTMWNGACSFPDWEEVLIR